MGLWRGGFGCWWRLLHKPKCNWGGNDTQCKRRKQQPLSGPQIGESMQHTSHYCDSCPSN